MEEKSLKRVTFTFEDDSERVLVGAELDDWETICSGKSDYLLPGNSQHVLASSAGGLIKGFVPPEAIGKRY